MTARPEGEGTARVAAVDLGTNNCRLLIADVGPWGFRPRRGAQRLVRLGECVARTGMLAPKAIARTLEALGTFDRIAREEGVTVRRGVITEVGRRARNVEEFLARARGLGWPLERASAEREARLTLLACAPLVPADAPWSVIVDVGGGSSEILLVEPGAPRVPALSLPFGAVTLYERFGDAREPAVFERVRAQVTTHLAASGLEARASTPKATAIGTSGTATVLTALALDLERLERAAIDGAVLTVEWLRTIRRQVQALPLAEALAHPLVGPGRADVLPTGAAILEAVLDWFGCTRFVAADRGPLEGLVREAAGERPPPIHLLGPAHEGVPPS